MLNKLFSSKARVEILKLFLFNPDDSFYQRQISMLTRQSIRGVQREVEKLQSIGLIEKSAQGNRLYYRVNRNCSIFEDLKRILFKTTGIAEALKGKLVKSDSIKIAFVYGSYAKGEESLSSDIDLLVIGNITLKELSRLLSKSKSEIGRETNYTVFKAGEFRKRIKQKDHFLNTVLKEKKLFIIGGEDELKTITESR